MNEQKNYWGYRINTAKQEYFYKELLKGRLRQGWGWDEGQNLKKLTFNDKDSRSNKRIFDRVRKGDILLVPRIPKWGEVAIVEATENFNEDGYRFEIDKTEGDFGHIFPVKFIKPFGRHNEHVEGVIRSTLRTPPRFWNLNRCGENIEEIIKTKDDVRKAQHQYDRFTNTITRVFQEYNFKEDIFKKFNENFEGKGWEDVLVIGLQKIFPYYEVEKVQGRSESKHGTDILVKIPSIIAEYQYAIAIQVKDYDGIVKEGVIEQIKKAECWDTEESIKLIDKIVIVTKAKKDANKNLLLDEEVKFIFAEELKDLLLKIAKNVIGSENE